MDRLCGVLLSLVIAIALLTPCAAVPLNVTVRETSHTVILPLERSFVFSVELQNNGDRDVLVNLIPENMEAEDWLIILPTGRILLSPGEKVEVVTTFEPSNAPGKREGELEFNFKFEVESKLYTVPLKVRYSLLDAENVPTEKVRVEVFNAESKQPIPEAEVTLSLPSGLLAMTDVTGPDGVAEFYVPSSSYLQRLYKKYNATVSFRGYFVEVYKMGYKAFYDSGVETGTGIKVFLEPQKKYFEYEKVGEAQTEYAIWWIKAPRDCSYIVTSPGAHAHIKPPDEVAVYIFSMDGKMISRFPIKVSNYDASDICWGLDVSPMGHSLPQAVTTETCTCSIEPAS